MPVLPETKLLDPVSPPPGYALRRAANAMMAILASRLAAIDLRISDASVMLLAAERDDMTSSEIGRVLDIQRANMVPLLNRLESTGMIRRLPIDRKSQAIVLTDEGRSRLAQVDAITAQFEDELMARIPEEHRPHFMPTMLALMG